MRGKHPGPPLQGREKGERGEGGGVGERRELRDMVEKMGKWKGEQIRRGERGDGTPDGEKF